MHVLCCYQGWLKVCLSTLRGAVPSSPADNTSPVKWRYPLKIIECAGVLCLAGAEQRASSSAVAWKTRTRPPRSLQRMYDPRPLARVKCVTVIVFSWYLCRPRAQVRLTMQLPMDALLLDRLWAVAKIPRFFPLFQCYGCSVTSNASGLFLVRRGWMSFAAMLYFSCPARCVHGGAARAQDLC